MIPKISVIVPCHNVAPFLNRSLSSICGQRLADIEIICIDDGSTDDTREMLESWALADARISVIKFRKRRGAGAARNAGIDAARGEYVGFVDSDDCVDADFYEKLWNRAVESGQDLIVGNFKQVKADGRVSVAPHRPARYLRRSRFCFSYHWTAIYRREFLNKHGIRYPDLSVGEDTVFETLVKVRVSTAKLEFVENAFYWYIWRQDSLTDGFMTFDKIRDAVSAVRIVIDIFNDAQGAGRMTAGEYKLAAFERFMCLPEVIFFRNTNPAVQKFVAESIIDVWQKLRLRESALSDPNLYRLGIACQSRDVGGVAKYCVQRRFKLFRRHYLFGFIPIAASLQWWNVKKFWLFGVLVYRQRTE
jgi:glycosyltransferase involved in cell wall biosynthesis